MGQYPPIVTSLPASPADGDLRSYAGVGSLVDECGTIPVYRYSAARAKWEHIGDRPAEPEVSSSYGDLPTVEGAPSLVKVESVEGAVRPAIFLGEPMRAPWKVEVKEPGDYVIGPMSKQLREQIAEALSGHSNDAARDVLEAVAKAFGIDYASGLTRGGWGGWCGR